ncbi:MAG: DUF397 domain-containing protein [Pseudonocardiaceae bacterium]
MNHDQALAALTTAAGWRKSSYSQAESNCVEVTTELATATGWHMSSYSQGQNGCVEVAAEWGGWVGVRDSKLGPHSPVLAVATADWHAVLAGVRAGDLA